MERKFGIAIGAAVIAFLVIWGGISATQGTPIYNRLAQCATSTGGYIQDCQQRVYQEYTNAQSLLGNAVLFGVIGAVVVGALVLVINPSYGQEFSNVTSVPTPLEPIINTIPVANRSERLKELEKLKEEGLVTQEEYEKIRAMILEEI